MFVIYNLEKEKETEKPRKGVGSVAAWPSAVEPNFPDVLTLPHRGVQGKPELRRGQKK
jgi:hypothetical protein